jgi:hypothetical protein
MLTIRTSPDYLPAKTYSFHVLLQEMLGIPFQVIPTPGARHHQLELPNGSTLELADHFLPYPQMVASAADIPGTIPHPFQTGKNVIGLYGKTGYSIDKQHCTLQTDLFAATFFMLTRLEECVGTTRDRHQRFPAAASLAVQAGFLHRPVVAEWSDLILEFLQHLGWTQPRPNRQYQLKLSCDVDHPRLWWSATDRFKTLGGALFKRFNLQEALYYAPFLWKQWKDPYDVFSEWFNMFEQSGHRVQFNFLGERPRDSDCWYDVYHPFVGKIMQEMASRGHSIGFHPGYEAFEDGIAFKKELESLQKVSPLPVTSGRQHYLRFAVPETWRRWHAAGLDMDSTLGYPEAEGFRCGMCCDYPVFDLENNTMLALREQPLVVMDVTLALYRQYTPEQAAERIHALQQTVQQHRGDFTLLWHNSSWNTPFWEPWKPVFLNILQQNAGI